MVLRRDAILCVAGQILGFVASRMEAAEPAAPTPGIERIGTGEYQAFYLVDGKIWGVGSNRAGQLGVGHTDPYAQVPPIRIKLPPDLRFIDVAGGGYQSLAVDSTGHVWTWGSKLFGQRGDGIPVDKTKSPELWNDGTPFRIPQDSTGKDFGDVIGVRSAMWFNVALKKDGTVWVWGMSGKEHPDSTGILGNGSTQTVAVLRPTQVPFEPGVSIVQIETSESLILARDSKGGVWSWGGGAAPKEARGTGSPDYSRPLRLPNLPEIKDIAAGGAEFSYALDVDGNLWGWGLRGTYLGIGPPNGGWVPVATPKKLSFPEFGEHKAVSVVASAHSTHVILDDGTLWGWGDSAMGEVGNGVMLDFSTRNYAWNWASYQAMVFRPVRIVPGVSNFRAIYTTSQCFYCYAVTADGRVYSWGRNKTGILGNGVLPTGDAGTHPDSWDVALATPVSPLTTPATKAPSRP